MEKFYQVKHFLEEEPILKKEFEELRNSLETFSDNHSREEFETRCDEYLNFLDFLDEIVSLPNNKVRKREKETKEYFY